MKYYVYVIKSERDKTLYKGLTSNLEKRLREHNQGKNQSTKNKGSYKLVYFEGFGNRVKAREREKFFNSGIGREQLKNFIYSSIAQW
ncbi:GIY-YIG nuclease family protein [Candidatus Daviesbacteria bacterium]|nr:GIY-YIG nuclease family protein [Candidatus Daviesbacteria bacterium]